MRIITSKTDQAIRNEFSRRNFLKLAGSTGFGIIVYSEVGAISLAAGPPAMKSGFDLKGFFDYFSSFALNIGMRYLGYRLAAWLPKNQVVQTAVQGVLKGLNDYLLYEDYNVMGGHGATFAPMYGQQDGLSMSPFFDLNNGSFRSEISFFSGAALPEVNRRPETEGDNQARRVAYLLPRRPKSNSYNNRVLPERYGTAAGSSEFSFKGNNKGGEVSYVLLNRGQGTLEQEYRKGNVHVSFAA